MQKTAIIFPCFNEQNRIKASDFQKFINQEKNIYFIFVNDGSTDYTQNILNSICNHHRDKSHIIRLNKNKGKAEAIRQGIIHAQKIKRIEIIGFMDADLSTPLKEIKNLITPLNQDISFVFASRIKFFGVDIKRTTFRHLIGRVFATFASKYLNTAIYDTQCGAKFFTIKVATKLFEEKFRTKWLFDIEIFLRFFKYFDKHNMREVPLQTWFEIPDSKLKIIHVFRIFSEMMILLKIKKIFILPK